jgi:glycosyltransferase involved in cell wall biosynthesis
MKWIAKLADFNVGVSRFVANELQALGVPAKKIGFVVNGVNVERFSPGIDAAAIRAEYGIAEDEILVMQLSRIWKEKRQEDLVRAFAIARTSVTSLRCLIVGWEDPRYGGPFASYLDELQHIRSKLNLGNDIIFGKPRPEAPELHAAADIEVLASVGEPCGLVVLEAMASGTAIIGARSGGIPELIDDGVNGFLVSPESPDLLAQKIVTLSLDPNLREQIGKAGRQKVVEFFSEARVSEQFARIYEALAHHQAVPKRSSLE